MSGFYWSANNPYLRSVWAKVRRAPKGLNPTIAMVETAPGQWDANGAHIIFECMTNRDWGMGSSIGTFDIPSFEISAQTLFNEKFGLSMMWTRQSSIEAYISEVIDHIHASLFVSPRTGLMTLKLLRQDYDPDTLREINPGNAVLTNFQRKMWGETANEVVVTYTDPATEGEASLAAQDIANIAMQGGIVSDGRNYYGIRAKDLAARVAERDLRAASQPLATCDAETNRTTWDLEPGDVVALRWPEKGIERIICRVGVCNSGDPQQRKIKTNLYEDIFGLAEASYLSPPDTEWVDPSGDPQPIARLAIHTAPAFLTALALELASPSDLAYPETISMILAHPNTRDDQDYELIGETAQANGEIVWTSFGARLFSAGATLATPIVAEVETLIPAFATPTGSSPLAGSILMFGSGSESSVEISVVKEVSESGWTVSRGVLDTVPRAWAAGTRVWAIATDRMIVDTTLRAAGEEVDYRLLTRTSRGTLPFDDAPSSTVVLTGRPHLPSRPANVKVNGTGFGSVAVVGGSISVTWENRNRLLETTQVLPWDAGNVVPESGQTTTIYVLSPLGAVLKTYNDLTGTSFTLPVSDFAPDMIGRIRVTAKRGGLESLQGHEIVISSITAETFTQGLSGETGSLLLSGDAQGGTDKLNIGEA